MINMTTLFVALGVAFIMASGYALLLLFVAVSVAMIPFIALYAVLEIIRGERAKFEMRMIDTHEKNRLRLVQEVDDSVEYGSDDIGDDSVSAPADLKKVIW